MRVRKTRTPEIVIHITGSTVVNYANLRAREVYNKAARGLIMRKENAVIKTQRWCGADVALGFVSRVQLVQ